MKKSLFLFTMFVTLLWVTQSCSDEQERSTAPRDVSFSLGLLRGDDAAGRTTAEIPDGAAVLITVTKADGTPVLSQERVNILHLGEGWVTAPVRLVPGDYTITDFWIVQDSSAVLFLIPQAGSPLASLVSRPVPLDFSVNANGIKNIPVEVVSTQNHQPEDFGYVSFGLSVVDAPAPESFRIAVFVPGHGGLMLTDATAFLIGSGDLNQTIPLAATVNTITHNDNFGLGFILYIHKPGYVSYRHSMSLPPNAPQYHEIPLQVILEEAVPVDSPAITLYGPWTITGGGPVDLSFEGAGTVYIDWGDGYTQKEVFDGGHIIKDHFHGVESWRTISIRHDLDKIVALEAGRGLSFEQGLQGIDVREAVNLKSLKLMSAHLDQLDLSHQTKLESLIIEAGETEMPTVLPADHNLRDIRLSFWDDNYSTLVGNIYANAVAKNIQHGKFWHSRESYKPALPQDAIDKLELLRTTYGWEVHYE